MQASFLIPKTGDCSDVIVKTPFGDIPWRQRSHFDDAEIKRLMIDVANRTCQFIHRLFDEETGGELLLRLGAFDLVPQWDTPRHPRTVRLETGIQSSSVFSNLYSGNGSG